MKLSPEVLAIRRLKARIKTNQELLDAGTLNDEWLQKFISQDLKELKILENQRKESL